MRAVQAIILDEWHELLGTKRGSLLELTLARLRAVAAGVRVGPVGNYRELEEAASIAVGSGLDPTIIVRTFHDTSGFTASCRSPSNAAPGLVLGIESVAGSRQADQS